MLVLGIETSCDETSAAVVAGTGDAVEQRSLVILSQDVHRIFGGVVPEIASRAHVTAIAPVVSQALREANVELTDIDVIAVTNAPGLVGALLVGVSYAKGLALGAGKPLIGVHHMEGHLFAQSLEHANAVPPFTALLVSGGHTLLVDVPAWGEYRILGSTRDDAAGEAFDKVAKLLGLGYPGGVMIDRLAKSGDPAAVAFPRAMTKKETGYEFSFSGLKTAVLVHVQQRGVPDGDEQALADLCASFQDTVVEVLVRKTRQAARDHGLRHVQLCGGVAANSRLRSQMVAAGAEDGFRVHVPPPRRCTDNAAMIAAAGFFRLRRGGLSNLALAADSALPLPAAIG